MNRGSLLFQAIQFAEEAAQNIMMVRERGYAITVKLDGSLVTDADRISQDIIVSGLRKATPDIPVIAEESTIQTPAPTPPTVVPSSFWLVDPLDGTREFVDGRDEFVVNIGLVQNHRAILGAVAVPALNELYFAVVGKGAWKCVDGRVDPIHTRMAPPYGLVVLISRFCASDARLEAILGGQRVAKRIRMGSGLKLCRLAEGNADLYPRPGRTMEWDTAGPQAVVEAAGGRVETWDSRQLTYGKPNWKNPPFICSGSRSQPLFGDEGTD